MTTGPAAGPFGNPNRCRPLVFDVVEMKASWERAISTYNTGFSIITQSRTKMPDEIGGLVWYGVDDTYFTCYTPLYLGINDVPDPFETGSMKEFSWESAWWRFNLLANYANTKFSYIIEDVKNKQNKVEGEFLQMQDSIEQKAMSISDKNELEKFLTDYCSLQSDYVMDEWEKLSYYVFAKYNDGYVRDENNRPRSIGYPEKWSREILKTDERIKLPVWDEKQKTVEPTDF